MDLERRGGRGHVGLRCHAHVYSTAVEKGAQRSTDCTASHADTLLRSGDIPVTCPAVHAVLLLAGSLWDTKQKGVEAYGMGTEQPGICTCPSENTFSRALQAQGTLPPARHSHCAGCLAGTCLVGGWAWGATAIVSMFLTCPGPSGIRTGPCPRVQADCFRSASICATASL